MRHALQNAGLLVAAGSFLCVALTWFRSGLGHAGDCPCARCAERACDRRVVALSDSALARDVLGGGRG